LNEKKLKRYFEYMQGKALKPSRRNEKKKEKTIINAKPNIFLP
jgi:hypothetical protein